MKVDIDKIFCAIAILIILICTVLTAKHVRKELRAKNFRENEIERFDKIKHYLIYEKK